MVFGEDKRKLPTAVFSAKNQEGGAVPPWFGSKIQSPGFSETNPLGLFASKWASMRHVEALAADVAHTTRRPQNRLSLKVSLFMDAPF
jgi:hypothetical protein